jgi:hypothetical protein
MKILNENINLFELKKLTEDEDYNFWVHPKFITGFKKRNLNTAENEYIKQHIENIGNDENDYQVIITSYLCGCLTKDSFEESSSIPVKEFISSAIYLIKDLYSSRTAYPFAWNGSYLIDKSNVNYVFLEIYKGFSVVEDNHIKNLLRVFCLELLNNFYDELSDNNKELYETIKLFITKNTYMY